MIPLTKSSNITRYSEMGAQAARTPLAAAGVDYTLIQQAYVGYVYEDSTSGRSAHKVDAR